MTFATALSWAQRLASSQTCGMTARCRSTADPHVACAAKPSSKSPPHVESLARSHAPSVRGPPISVASACLTPNLPPPLRWSHDSPWYQSEVVIQGVGNTSAQHGHAGRSKHALCPTTSRGPFRAWPPSGSAAPPVGQPQPAWSTLHWQPTPSHSMSIRSLGTFAHKSRIFLRHSLVFKLLIPQSPITARVTPETVACHSERTFNVVPVGIECCSRANTSHVVLQPNSRYITNGSVDVRGQIPIKAQT